MFRHELVRALVVHYAQQAGHHSGLRVFTRVESFERIRRRRRYQDAPTNEHRDLGSTLPGRRPVVLINVALHSTVGALANTCAHEAIHIADPALRHGPEFRRRVRALLRGATG